MTDDQDFQLIEAIQAGGEEGCTLLLDRYGGYMLTIARRYMRDENDAQDCVQEACLLILKSIHKFERKSLLKSWIHRIVINQCLGSLRRRQRSGVTQVPFEEAEAHFDAVFDEYGLRRETDWDFERSVESIVAEVQNRQLIFDAINKLSDDFRNVLLLRDIEDYSTKEAAVLLDVSEALVKTRLHRARAALKGLLEPLLERK